MTYYMPHLRPPMAVNDNADGPKNCPICGEPPTIEPVGWGWFVSCPRCYDGGDERPMGSAMMTALAAVNWWDELVEDYKEGWQ